MNVPRSARSEALALALITLGVLLPGPGCDRVRQDDQPAPTRRLASSKEPTRSPQFDPRKVEGSAPTAGRSPSSITAMSQRVARLVEEAARSYKEQLASHGLVVPKCPELEIRTAPAVADSPRKTLIASRVREVLADELSRLEGLTLRDPSSSREGAPMTVVVGVTTNFDAAFQAFHCSFELQNFGDTRRVYRDSFDDQGLVCIKSPGAESETKLVVSAAKEDLRVAFQVVSDNWFLMPTGRYRNITVRSKGALWAPPTLVVGAQNFWDLSTNPPSGSDATITGQQQPYVPPPERVLDGETEQPRLIVVRPVPNETVGRIIAVSGIANALEGTQVRVVVIVGAEEYLQDHEGVVSGGRWRVPRVVIGRVDEDIGKTFAITAIARPKSGKLIKSQTVMVARK